MVQFDTVHIYEKHLHRGNVLACAWRPDDSGTSIATAAVDKTIMLQNLEHETWPCQKIFIYLTKAIQFHGIVYRYDSNQSTCPVPGVVPN
jgi:hypothetical protein